MSLEKECSPRLFQLFFDCYEEFDAKFPKGGCSNTIISFGVSGCGKSTFLARLRDNRSPDAFYNGLPKDTERVKTEGIEIGAGLGSTTLVPALYDVGEMKIFDVPGFKDTDYDKEIVINILHKCLLTRVQEAKFLVIINVNDILSDEQEKFDRIITDYHNKLKELFGSANYEGFIETVHFVFTKNDGGKYSEDEINAKLNKIILQAVSKIKNEGLLPFLGRMVEKHLTVDYTSDTKDGLRAKITEFVSAKAGPGVRLPNINQQSLEMHANVLDDFCRRTMDAKTEDIVQFGQRLKELFGPVRLKVEALREELHRAQTLVAEQHHEIEWRSRDIGKNKGKRSETREQIIKCDADITHQQESIKRLENDQKFMARTLEEFASVSMRGDVARNTGGAVMGPYYEFKSNIFMEPHEHEKMVCLAVGHEQGDETLRKYINNNGSLVPKDIETVQSCKAAIVKLNNSLNIEAYGFFKTAKLQYDLDEKVLNVTLTSYHKFKVLIYTAVPFATTAAAVKQKEFYEKALIEARDRLERLKQDCKAAADANDEAANILQKYGARVAQLEVEVKNSERAAEAKENDFKASVQSAYAYFDEKTKALSALEIARDSSKRQECDANATLIREVGRIYDANGLKSDLLSKIQAHEAAVAACKSSIQDLMTKVRLLEHLKEVTVAKGQGAPPSYGSGK